MMSAPEHGLDKLVWTDADCHRMGWHDSSIHAFHSGHRPERGAFLAIGGATHTAHSFVGFFGPFSSPDSRPH